VQDVVEGALATVLRLAEPPQATVAGRTDAGVHARGQVCHVDVPAPAWSAWSKIESSVLPRLAGVLPRDVRVTWVAQAPVGFDARFAALSRRYAYRVGDDPAGVDPLRRHEVLWHPRPLDVGVMSAASAPLLGEHDFAAFCRPREGATTLRRLLRFDWARAERGLAIATVEADAFCHSMVRSLVGALLPVGEGRRRASWPAELLAAGTRDSAVTVVPPHGLTLEEVRYPPDDQLASRVAETRRPRVRSPS
jgi:tRNA pseudouridine38-40 synthase